MNVAVIGCGYVGLTVAACLAGLGHRVCCADIDPRRIKTLKQGKSPIYEPGLEELLNRFRRNLSFTAQPAQAVEPAEVVFIAVSTPTDGQWQVDVEQVEAVAKMVGCHLSSYKVVVNKSTAPVGTCVRIAELIWEVAGPGATFDVVANPEFLREGSAIADFLHPQRIVLGTASTKALEVMLHLYHPIIYQELPFDSGVLSQTVPIPVVVVTPETAEMIKYASNAFLAAKISFINEVGQLCKRLDIDVRQVAQGMGYDPRIAPYYLEAGLGFGGACLPKDTRGLIGMAKSLGCDSPLLEAVLKVNDKQWQRMVQMAKVKLGSLKGRSLAILGLAFKPGTEDIRESPALGIVEALLSEGACLWLYDPAALPLAKEIWGDRVRYASSAEEAVAQAEAVFIATAWEEFKSPSLYQGKIIFDGRRALDRVDGLDYTSLF